MDKMREEFEGWAKVNGLRLDRQKSMCGGDMGRYDFGPTQAALEVWCDAWQGSRAALCVDLPCGLGYPHDDMLYLSDVENALDKEGVAYK